MLYTVKYKKPGWVFWRRLEEVKADGVIEMSNSRFFILDDETRIEIPTTFIFEFDKKRFYVSEAQIQREMDENKQKEMN